jgi:hypothetical protein
MIVSICPLKVLSIIVIITQLSKLMLYRMDIWMDMEQGDLDLLLLLFSVNAFGVQVSQIMQSLKGTEAGTYLPKRMYNMNQKTEQLQDLALGLIPGSSDAKKTIAKLEE